MAVFQKEAGVCHGRGFSAADPNGYMARFVSWVKKPAADGSPQTATVVAATDIFTAAGHGYNTGDSIMFTTTNTLPAGLALLTEYYIIKIDANTFYVATTYDRAKAGTAVDITDAGTGTHSVYLLGGGPGWFIYDDMSDTTLKAFTADASTDVITCTAHGLGTGSYIRFTTTQTLPGGISAGTTYTVIRVDANTIKVASSLYVALVAGSAINITNAGSGTHYLQNIHPTVVVCDTSAPTANDISGGPSSGPSKFIQIGYVTTEAGYIRAYNYCWWNKTTHKGEGLWWGSRLSTYDDADFAYNFRGGAECMFIQSRLGTTWYSAYWDEWTGDSKLVESVDKYGTLQSGVTAGSSVVLQLDTGEAANFTADKYYYIFDFANAKTWVNYCKVTDVDLGTDQITVNTLTQNFPAGSVIVSYAHRWIAATNGIADIANIQYYSKSGIPYYSSTDSGQLYVIHNQWDVLYGGIVLSYATNYIEQIKPDDEGYYAIQKPGFAEFVKPNYRSGADSYTGMNRGYGTLKNIVITYNNSMAAAQDGRRNGAVDYLFFNIISSMFNNASSSHAVCILDTESVS